eukprot:UN01832
MSFVIYWAIAAIGELTIYIDHRGHDDDGSKHQLITNQSMNGLGPSQEPMVAEDEAKMKERSFCF